MGGLATESSALILGFSRRHSNAVLPHRDYESHAIGSLPASPPETGPKQQKIKVFRRFRRSQP
jgi:hypothetical protein